MTTKTPTTSYVALSTEDQALADKLKARGELKKDRKPVFPVLMAIV
ncbi:MAG TPA: hypothetical protein VMZ28_14395 [Kofleriaceae bacterium]|nr:hypothetical protein [Kofleriaceae bacterium]